MIYGRSVRDWGRLLRRVDKMKVAAVKKPVGGLLVVELA